MVAGAAVAGFTLVEVLVVVLVIGLAAGLAWARLDADPRALVAREARTLAAAMEHAAALAQWRNQAIAVSAVPGGYRFWRRESSLEGDRWVPLVDDDVLSVHALPAGLSAAVVALAGMPVSGDTLVPLLPSGRNEPYAIEIAANSWRTVLVADPLNRVTISPPSER
jgi:type II secretion system protein H